MTHDADSGTIREFLSRHLSRFYIYIYSFFSRGVRYDDRSSASTRYVFFLLRRETIHFRSSFDRRYPGSWSVLGWGKIARRKTCIEAYRDGRAMMADSLLERASSGLEMSWTNEEDEERCVCVCVWKTETRIELIEIPDGLGRRFITLGHNRPVLFPLLPFGFAARRPKG